MAIRFKFELLEIKKKPSAHNNRNNFIPLLYETSGITDYHAVACR